MSRTRSSNKARKSAPARVRETRRPRRLIVGLGNPGTEYAETRHNAGAWFLDVLRRELALPDFSLDQPREALVSQRRNIILAFPQTFMNASGRSVAKILRHVRVPPDRLAVVHDDKDLLVGTFKLQYDRSSAGHKGVESIIRALKTQAFWRLRIGTGTAVQREPTEAFVLKRFSRAEEKLLSGTVFPEARTRLRTLLDAPLPKGKAVP